VSRTRYARSGGSRIAHELRGRVHRRRPWLVLVQGMGFDRIGWQPVLVCEAAGMGRPHVLFWGHEPRSATGWTDPERVGAYVYNTATGQAWDGRFLTLRSSWRRSAWATTASCPATARTQSGRSSPCSCCLATMRQKRGGFGCTGRRFTSSVQHSMLIAACPVTTCVRSCIRSWTRSGAIPPGQRQSPGPAIPTTAGPAGTAMRPLARLFTEQDWATRGDRARLAGSLALSTPEIQGAYLSRAPERELAGAPETDLRIRVNS
jgi:hypothetical protein